jgi:hypothetical protein
MTYPALPILDPSTDAGWREWDIYLRRKAMEHSTLAETFWEGNIIRQDRDIASREALALSQEHIASAQQAAASAMITSAQIFANSTPIFDGALISEMVSVARYEAPEDWINRAIMRLQQFQAAYRATFPSP